MTAALDRLTGAIATLSAKVDQLPTGGVPNDGATAVEVNAAADAVEAVTAKVDAKIVGLPFPTDPNPFPGESVAEAEQRLKVNEQTRVAMAANASRAAQSRAR